MSEAASPVTILCGDVLAVLATLPADSVDCVVTSPPYWGLRDYGVAGQIGLERTLGQHLEVMVAVFRAVRRVLKPTGSCWVNYGDCYATSPNGRSAAEQNASGTDDRVFRDKPFSTIGPVYEAQYEKTPRMGRSANKGSIAAAHGGRVTAGGYLKPKDLCMVPNRVAIALQDDGWWVRSEIVWGKPNAMPDSSGRWRPATAHEKIFLLSKTGKMFYDAEAVRVPASGALGDYKNPDGWNTGSGAHGSFHPAGREKGERADKPRGHSRRHAGFNDRWDAMAREEQQANGRLLRNYEPDPFQVLHMATAAFKGAHFATFPPSLAAVCIAAGCPAGGHVLDPFGGSGTTGFVAARMGRSATLIELNPDTAEMARQRVLAETTASAMEATKARATYLPVRDAGPLFGDGAE